MPDYATQALYIVELSFMETQESNDSINEGPSITMEGPSQTNVVLVPLHDVTCRNHQTEFKSDIKLYRRIIGTTYEHKRIA